MSDVTPWILGACAVGIAMLVVVLVRKSRVNRSRAAAVAGCALLASSDLSLDDVAALAGAGATVIGIVWSVWEKRSRAK